MSRFAMLCELAKNEYYQKEFKRFKHIAIVLNDPHDTSFKKYMQSKFENLDKETGLSFLFISFLNRPNDWQPGYDIEHGILELTAGNNTDDAQLMYTFCQRADISTQNLPKILLLENLDSQEYIALPTTKSTIEEQLIAIGQFCDEQALNISSDQMRSFVHKRFPNTHITMGLASEPISTILSDLYAIECANDNSQFNFYRGEAKRRIMDAKNRLQKVYENATTSAKEKALSDWMNYTAQCEMGKKPRLNDSISVSGHNHCVQIQHKEPRAISTPEPKGSLHINLSWIKGCEYDSELDIKRFNALRKNDKNLLYRIFDRSSVPLDDSLYSKYLGQFLERELNYSLVQHIRQVLGIPMPEYYNSVYHKKNGSYSVTTDKKMTIKFNAYTRETNDLKTVTLGDMITAYRVLLEEEQEGLIDYGRGFVNLICELYPLRNLGTHKSNMFTHQDAEQMYGFFIDFLREYFPELMQLKRQLRS